MRAVLHVQSFRVYEHTSSKLSVRPEPGTKPQRKYMAEMGIHLHGDGLVVCKPRTAEEAVSMIEERNRGALGSRA